MSGTQPTTVIAWLDPEQVPLVKAVLDAAGLTLVAAGSPRLGRSSEVAARLGLDSTDAQAAPTDLRSVLTSRGCDAVFVASPGEFGGIADSSGSGDLDALMACRARGVKVAVMEPIPASPMQLAASAWTGAGSGSGAAEDSVSPSAEITRFLPLMRLSPSMHAVADVLAQFGPVRSMLFESWGRGIEGSLGARLLDAMDCVLSMIGEPERLDASYVWPGHRVGGDAGTALRRLTGESLRGLSGDMTVNLRFGDGRAAAIAISDSAGRWSRRVVVVGSGGRITVDDAGFEWVSPEGAHLDGSGGNTAAAAGTGKAGGRGTKRAERREAPPDAAAVIGEALSRYVHARETASAPVDYRRVLAMAGAALLSCRTGEGESPHTILRMTSVTA